MNFPILLTTLNARYHHTAFGLRYLYANLNEFQSKAQILEFTTSQNPRDIAESILEQNPQLVGFGVYIWNTESTYEVVSILKKVRPELLVVLGGPEVSYETSNQSICHIADFTIQGEGDHQFYEFCRSYFNHSQLPKTKWIPAKLPEINQIQFPYPYYSDSDIQNRVIYVEASRGCPYKCEYCLSSLDKSVRSFDLDGFLEQMDQLIQRGARQFKFVDRTFNLSISSSTKILQFFLDRIELGLFLHFEMVPDRLPTELRGLIQKFPKGSLQFEIGIQTWNPEVAVLVSRRQNYQKIQENFKFLTSETGVHIHADLIVGLPGETLESFAKGFDSVDELRPDEIQVGILKRLKGTPIIRHDQNWEMVYQNQSPFQILKTKTMSFEILQRLGRFSQFWDLYANSGNFKCTMELIRARSQNRSTPSLFWEFYEFSQFMEKRHPQRHGIALMNLVESAWHYLTQNLKLDSEQVREALIKDYTGTVKRDIPSFLRPLQTGAVSKKTDSPELKNGSPSSTAIPSRQKRHLSLTQ